MTQREHEAILSISLLAAMADGVPNDSERARLQGIAASLGNADGGQSYAAAYQRVILGTSSIIVYPEDTRYLGGLSDEDVKSITTSFPSTLFIDGETLRLKD